MPPVAPLDPLTGIEAARFAAYVHYPFCLSKCPYCDFASIASKAPPHERYARALLREVELRGASKVKVDAVFFGGGTPSLWPARHVAEVLETLSVAPNAEVTLEANPGAADATRFREYRAVGINRLSIGVQSFEPSTLKALGREHDGAMAEAAFRAARAAGFDNVSLDFIYGVHGQTLEQVVRDAARAAALEPEHLSAYALTLEREALAEEVPLARQLSRGEVTLPEDEVVLAMQRAVAAELGEHGLQRYEVSNYARPGFHSRHNACYWTGGEYLALGAGATGRVGAVRYQNHRSAEKYFADVEAGRLPEASREALDGETLSAERVAMGLRLVNGVKLDVVSAGRAAALQRFEREGLVVRGERVRLTERGFDLHSAVAAALM
ncbi:MAG: radical SAM family heme chaperone HemW [Archangiaceae bacterium]|nr:radical SAM family heme chaperone HemW [Archangiaceae bacterium]